MRSIGALGGHGILTETDLVELNAGTRRVYNLMKDGRWHLLSEICKAAGTYIGMPASAGGRRMRELRDVPWLEVDRERIPGSRLFRYRLRSTYRTPSILPAEPEEEFKQGEMLP